LYFLNKIYGSKFLDKKNIFQQAENWGGGIAPLPWHQLKIKVKVYLLAIVLCTWVKNRSNLYSCRWQL